MWSSDLSVASSRGDRAQDTAFCRQTPWCRLGHLHPVSRPGRAASEPRGAGCARGAGNWVQPVGPGLICEPSGLQASMGGGQAPPEPGPQGPRAPSVPGKSWRALLPARTNASYTERCLGDGREGWPVPGWPTPGSHPCFSPEHPPSAGQAAGPSSLERPPCSQWCRSGRAEGRVGSTCDMRDKTGDRSPSCSEAASPTPRPAAPQAPTQHRRAVGLGLALSTHSQQRARGPSWGPAQPPQVGPPLPSRPDADPQGQRSHPTPSAARMPQASSAPFLPGPGFEDWGRDAATKSCQLPGDCFRGPPLWLHLK